MFDAISIIKGLLSLASALTQYFRDKKLMNAGAAESVLEGLKNANEAIVRANAARATGGLPVDKDTANRDN